MCGIAGFIGRGDAQVLRRMTDAIRHRGPDAEGHWSDESAGVFLGHRRLSIIDLSGGAQPMWTADGKLGVVFNGEIYNHAELRAELVQRGCQFATDHSDTEVLLHAYREWGDGFVERLNGMWAFVIYDRERRRLFGSRDRFGKKPLYYFHEGDTFGFASELPALTQHPACPRSISALSLKKYFAYCYIPAPRSIYERVWKLPGGHSFVFDLGAAAELTNDDAVLGRVGVPPGTSERRVDEPSRDDDPPPFVASGGTPDAAGGTPTLPGRNARLRLWRWWKFVIDPDDAMRTEPNRSQTLLRLHDELGADRGNLGDCILRMLDRAVKRRLMSDVPLGVFLSGGIDSSAIAALAAKHVPAGQLNTFSIGFNEPSFDESSHARLVAKELGTNHREEILDLDKSVALTANIAGRLDEPLGDGSLLPTYLLSRFTRRHVTVALGGDGGDELFAGYDPFRALRKAELYAKLVPKPIHAGIRHLAALLPVSHANISFDFKVKRTLMGLSYPPPLWNAVWMSALEPRDIGELFREPAPVEDLYSEAIEAWDRCAQPNIVDRALQFWTNLYLQDGILAKVDRASMMTSLEVRSPFLDIEFVNLARRIPWQLKLRDGQTKWILKKALAPLLPKEIIERPKKGFGMPIGRWMSEGKFDLNPMQTAPLLDSEFIVGKSAEHRARRADHRLFLWSYWLFARWRRNPGSALVPSAGHGVSP